MLNTLNHPLLAVVVVAAFIGLAVYSHPTQDMHGNNRQAVLAFYDANSKTSAEVVEEMYSEDL